MKIRNYNIDLLRIFATFMIIILHILGQGGILDASTQLNLKYGIVWFLELVCVGAVNIYALISGYVLCENEVKYHKIVVLWIEVFFYSFFILIFFYFFRNKFNIDITFKLIVGNLFPLSNNLYWYFTSYFGMFLFIPLLNFIINNFPKKKLHICIFMGIVIYSFFPVVWVNDIFLFNNGYSVIWLAFLYVIGGYIKKYYFTSKLSKKKWLLIYFFSIFFAWFCIILLKILSFKIPILADFNFIFLGYNMLTTFIASISLFIFIININIKNTKIIKLITIFSPVTFGVYLIHTNPMIFNYILKNSFIEYVNYNFVLLILFIIITAIVIYLICTIIELFRIKLFNILNIDKKTKIIINKFGKKFGIL